MQVEGRKPCCADAPVNPHHPHRRGNCVHFYAPRGHAIQKSHTHEEKHRMLIALLSTQITTRRPTRHSTLTTHNILECTHVHTHACTHACTRTCDGARGTYSLAILPNVHSLTSSALTLSALAPQVLLKSRCPHTLGSTVLIAKLGSASRTLLVATQLESACAVRTDFERPGTMSRARPRSLLAWIHHLDGLVDGAWRARAREMLGENARFGSCLFTDSPPVTNFHTATTAGHRKISENLPPKSEACPPRPRRYPQTRAATRPRR